MYSPGEVSQRSIFSDRQPGWRIMIGAHFSFQLLSACAANSGGTVVMNQRRKHQIQDEFARRRLALPVTLAPGQTVQGSLFFRITPSPRELALPTGGDAVARISLAPLAGLHLKVPPANVAAAK